VPFAGQPSGSGFDASQSPPPSAPPPGYQYQPPPGYAAGPPREALAGFWIRFLGAMVDNFLLFAVAALIGAVFGLGAGALDTAAPSDTGLAVFASTTNLLGLVLRAAYFTYFHATAAGQTVGNKVVGIRVVDADNGGALSYVRAFLRYLMSIVSGIPLFLGYLWMLWDDRKQTWHDKVGNSLVVKAAAYPPPAPFGRPASS
jgi:uncharacterized RDD family membrane protein YckC